MGDKSISLRLDDGLLGQVEDEVDSSFVFENRSQLIRAALRAWFSDEKDEFKKAQ